MTRHGSYKIRNRGTGFSTTRADEGVAPDNTHGFDPLGSALRAQRVVDSLRHQVCQAHEGHSLRVRQIFQTPREIYRVEYEIPALSYQRTVLLDRDALEELLEEDAVRELLVRDLDGEEVDDRVA